MNTWKRASEITEPGAYWVDDRRGDGKTPLYITNVLQTVDGILYAPGQSMRWHGLQLANWDKNIYLLGPIEPPEVEGKK